MTSCLLWASARKKRAVEHTEFQFPGGVRDCDREQARIFVIHVAQFNAVPMSVGCQAETLPVEEVLRQGQSDPWPLGRKCGVGHDVALERFYERHTGILTAAAAIGPPFIIGFRLQCNAEPLDASRIAGFVESHSRNPDARIISFRYHPRKQIEFPIGSANGCWIQDAFDFHGIAGFRFHQHPQAA